jgi:hypothetical protein
MAQPAPMVHMRNHFVICSQQRPFGKIPFLLLLLVGFSKRTIFRQLWISGADLHDRTIHPFAQVAIVLRRVCARMVVRVGNMPVLHVPHMKRPICGKTLSPISRVGILPLTLSQLPWTSGAM